MEKIILVTGSARASLENIRGAAAGWTVTGVDSLPLRGSAVMGGASGGRVEAVLGAPPQNGLAEFPNLRWVHSQAAGVDAWMKPGLLPPGAVLTSAAGNGAVPLAEHALMLMLMLSRQAPRWFEAQRNRRWDRFTHGELTGAQVGLIGYGNSGQDLARKALACHMDVQALRRKGSDEHDGPVRLLYGRQGLTHLLATSDFVVVTAPATAETRGLLGEREILRMKRGSSLIVVSRGGIIDDGAVLAALQDGHLGGVGLDAHTEEPLPPDSPFWELPNAIITPHNGATTELTAQRGEHIMLENVRRFVAGRTLRNVVDMTQGY